MTAPEEMFANRLRKNLRHLAKWRKREQVENYRLYDADLPDFAVAVDVYQADEKIVVVQEYKAPAQIDPEKARLRLQLALEKIQNVLEVGRDQVFLKTRQQHKGKSQYVRISDHKTWRKVEESGLEFLVDFSSHLDTGLFLDHRITRNMLADLSRGRRFLNLFAYTGSATVYAVSGGARTSLTLDLSKVYLNWAQENLALNGLSDETRHRFEQTDCLEWLRSGGNGEEFDLIFLDPPSFSTSKRMRDTLDVQRDHVRLIEQSCGMLSETGILIFSNNLRSFKLDHDALSEYDVEDISYATLPPDFKRNAKIHQAFKIKTTEQSRKSLEQKQRKPW